MKRVLMRIISLTNLLIFYSNLMTLSKNNSFPLKQAPATRIGNYNHGIRHLARGV